MASVRDYLSMNRSAYDALASSYQARAAVDRLKDIPLVAPFISYLKSTFKQGVRVLDIGFGNGVNLQMLQDAGFVTFGIDISSEMLKIATITSPLSNLILGDFLTMPFDRSTFHGIFAKASLHCLPKADALQAFRKVHELLVPDGLLYVTTTAERESSEGLYVKDDYPGRFPRFRKRWTPRELSDSVLEAGFSIHADSYDFEADWQKLWYNIWAIKRTSHGKAKS